MSRELVEVTGVQVNHVLFFFRRWWGRIGISASILRRLVADLVVSILWLLWWCHWALRRLGGRRHFIFTLLSGVFQVILQLLHILIVLVIEEIVTLELIVIILGRLVLIQIHLLHFPLGFFFLFLLSYLRKDLVLNLLLPLSFFLSPLLLFLFFFLFLRLLLSFLELSKYVFVVHQCMRKFILKLVIS